MAALDEVVEAIRAGAPEVQAVYLFGSRASGTSSGESDYDLAVLAPVRLEDLRRWSLQEKLAELLRAPVDLVDLRAASAVMRVQVLGNSQLLLDLAPTERALFEATALSDYARLNEERRAILEDIRRRGTVYG